MFGTKLFLRLGITAFLFCPVALAYATDTESPDSINDAGEINQIESPDGPAVMTPLNGTSQLSGVLVDRTVTIAGKTFYRTFSQLSMDKPIVGNSTLTIHERPDARWGTQLWVAEGNKVFFRTQLPPRLAEIDRIAGQAVEVVEESLLEHRITTALSSDADLGKEEL